MVDFRAGLVTSLAKQGVPEATCKMVGRWSSDAWKKYCKQGRSLRMADMKFVTKAVLSSVSNLDGVILVEDRDCRVSWS